MSYLLKPIYCVFCIWWLQYPQLLTVWFCSHTSDSLKAESEVEFEVWNIYEGSLPVKSRETQSDGSADSTRNISPRDEGLRYCPWESAWEAMVELSHPHQRQAASGRMWLWTRLLSEAEINPEEAVYFKSCRWAAQSSFKGLLVIFVSIIVMFGSSHSCCPVNLLSLLPSTASTLFPSICCEVMGLDAVIFIFECWVLIQYGKNHITTLCYF